MNEFLTADILKQMVRQKHALITVNPKLQNFFTDIYFSNPDIKNNLPFLPIRCFRDFTLHIGKQAEENTTFFSSGSTHAIQAKHVFTPQRLGLYAQHSTEGFLRFLKKHNLNKNIPVISLIPAKEIWNKSSLAAMISMFKDLGLNIIYCNIEKDCQNLKKILENNGTYNQTIIFGTTFHHIIVSEFVQSNKIEKLFKGNKLALIDTGGTKGRTQNFSLEETKIIFKKTYGNPNEFLFLSEYGMCELASQAWSAKSQHDGTFICNKTMVPVAINLKERKILKVNEYGFLGFIDSLNMDTWPSIITDDIGCIFDQEEGIFELKGRAPDATLKGCSLNVKETFFFSELSLETDIQEKLPRNIVSRENFHSPADVFSFIETLDSKVWTSFCWADLASTLFSWNEIQIKNIEKLKDKNILIISSANIPITWVYPARVACLLGANSIHIKLPSLRGDDLAANRVRAKIEDLTDKLEPFFFPTKIVVEKTRNLSKDLSYFDAAIVFGTNNTIETFTKKLKNSKTHLIPQGDVKNSLKVGLQYSTEEVAKLCSLWLGRGCLTPICLFMSGRSEEQTYDWLKEFQFVLEKNFIDRFKEEGLSGDFIHATHVLYTEAIVKNLGLDPKEAIFSGKIAQVINLTKLGADEVLQSRLDFSFGGCGLVFALDESLKTTFPQFANEKVIPTLTDNHGGKTWEEWFDF
ncbi:hypothetical protein [Fluviispira multicolorata]|uniref:Uncharacterized protein n=1 Tax=Fluviispira multicolorata TaxID=2654512 RepID=A0A833JER3_9BACT|nr:hypothetical protein [Fluviispira multicolorata]KAB8033346.1 hypothetical protein GCL57_01205 [Fluviispira multicolorata]